MTKSYVQLTQEIEALQRQAEAVREKEVAEVIGRIKEAIAFYGLTAADLGLAHRAHATNGAATQAAPPKAAKKQAPKKKAAPAVKYRDDAGHTWSGMGPRPGWLKAALAAGASLESLTV